MAIVSSDTLCDMLQKISHYYIPHSSKRWVLPTTSSQKSGEPAKDIFE